MAFGPYMLFVLIAGAMVLYAIWTSANPSWPIRIVVTTEGMVECRGLPRQRVPRFAEFFEQHVQAEPKLVVLACRDAGGGLRTSFRGHIDAGTKQRIRNYMLAEL
ncbi:hypothetical protein [Aeoliella mucimassa]|uniref:Uncharacterized protein n=1 Tax=Aeoliella mucimassa TaxID=2527972 RepID=A0A518ANL2_9BACT|nr:hypothetical protein [Aeoliella mucimassa]QDU56313.1 hypothetical protein Pan181_25220 [Aeoliella mucimassa]